MKFVIFSDPHLGCNRRANTTVTSRKLLKKELVGSVEKISKLTHSSETAARLFCGGDFFDTYSNEEADLLDGLRLARNMDMILSGNHDQVNDVTKIGSLDVIQEVLDPVGMYIPKTVFGNSLCAPFTMDGVLTIAVPHHSNQALLEEALQQAYDRAEKSNAKYKLLFLHCNYDMPEDRLNDVTLNLTNEDSQALLDVFNYVLLGHEHTPASYHGGRLLIIGSTFPTSFGDISDKRILEFDTETGEMESRKIWDKTEGYETIDAEDLLEPGELEIPETCRFIDVTGAIDASDAGAFARAVYTQLWENPTGKQLIGVRNNTSIRKGDKEVVEGIGEEAMSLVDQMSSALDGTDMAPLWQQILSDIQGENPDHD